jgi:RNA polymerase sigma factor (sigma-70 family)
MADPTDAELAALLANGDPSAWGDIFDRHRDAVWRLGLAVTRRPEEADDVLSVTFLKAVESIKQLDEPERLRPWLLSIARRAALDRVRPARTRETPSELIDTLAEVSGPPDDGELLSGLTRGEIAGLVAAALDGLDPRDRAALELADGQGASGDDVAGALGVRRANAYALVANARERFSASVGALLVARHGRGECQDVDQLLAGWDGRLDIRLRKRLARHVRGCESCGATRDRLASPAALLAAVPFVLPSAAVVRRARDATVAAASTTPSPATGSPGPQYVSRVDALTSSMTVRVAALVGAAGLATAGGVLWSTGSPTGIATASPTTVSADPPDTTASTASDSSPPGTSLVSTVDGVATTAAALEDPCEVVADLRDHAAAGPASASSEDLARYLAGTDAQLQTLLAALGPDQVSPELDAYAAAYRELVEGGLDPASAAADSDLRTLRDRVEQELGTLCPGSS